jgi:DNA-binding beta-propeller fold protein YncE
MLLRALAVLLSSALPLAAQTALVVDEAGRAIATVDLDRGAVVSTAALPFTPDRALLAGDGTTLLVLDQGEGTYGFWAGEFRPKGKSNAAIVREGKLVASTELGWGLAESAFSADGASAFVLTTGYESNKPNERKESELVRIDLATGKITGRMALDAAASAFATDEKSKVGIIYSPPYPKKKPAPLPARLTFVDLESLETITAIDIAGTKVERPVAVGDLLYVVDGGSKIAGGSLTIVRASTGEVLEKIGVGPEAVFGGSDKGGRLFVLSQAPDRKSGRVTVLEGTKTVAEYPIGAAPKTARLSADDGLLYVLGWKEFSVVDLKNGKAFPPAEQARAPFAVLGSADGTRAFTINMDGDQCCRITAFDLATMKPLTSFLGGSKGERFGQVLAAVALTAASYQAGKSIAESSGSSTFYYSIYAPAGQGSARGPLAFGPGEKKVYFVDTQTNDVTIVDAATGERLRTLDAGSGLQEVIPLHDAGLVAGIANTAITLVDVATDEVRETIKLDGAVTDAVLTGDGRRLIVFGRKSVVVLDAKSGKEISRITSLQQPVQIVFAGP